MWEKKLEWGPCSHLIWLDFGNIREVFLILFTFKDEVCFSTSIHYFLCHSQSISVQSAVWISKLTVFLVCHFLLYVKGLHVYPVSLYTLCAGFFPPALMSFTSYWVCSSCCCHCVFVSDLSSGFPQLIILSLVSSSTYTSFLDFGFFLFFE